MNQREQPHIVLIDAAYQTLDALGSLLGEAEVDGQLATFTIFQDAYAFIQASQVTVAFVGEGFGFLGQLEYVRALSRLNRCAIVACLTVNSTATGRSTETTVLLKKAGAHALFEQLQQIQADKSEVVRQVVLNALQQYRSLAQKDSLRELQKIELPQLLERVAKRLELAAHSVTGPSDVSSKRIQEQLLKVFASIESSD